MVCLRVTKPPSIRLARKAVKKARDPGRNRTSLDLFIRNTFEFEEL